MNHQEYQIAMNKSKYTRLGLSTLISQSWKASQNQDLEAMNELLCWSASVGHKDLMNFLLTDSDLKTHADLHAKNDHVFLSALTTNNKEILEFLINDLKIEKTEHIDVLLDKFPSPEIESLFNNRNNKKSKNTI